MQEFAPALPEIILAVAAMALLMVGAFRKDSASVVSWLAAVVSLVVMFIVATGNVGETAFGGSYVSDAFSQYAKVLILIATAAAIVMSMGYNKAHNINRFEFPVLMLLSALGMCMMVSANDLIALYMGIEMQSLPLYVLAAFRRDSLRATESGLKYFVLGALSSGMLLYGASMIYGFTGATGFDQIATALAGEKHASIGLLIGIVFLTAGLAFKVSAVPFHMWTPDVYEGAPTPVTAFFASAPKVAAMALFIRAMMEPFGTLVADWQQIIWIVALASMLLGAFAAIAQKNIKRLMAYSSIGHVGFALVGLAAGTEAGIKGVLVYLAIYVAMNIGTFACILSMQRSGKMVENISDLAGLSKSRPFMALVFATMLFSLAGIPPLAGFFGKFYVFLAAVNAELYVLAVVGVVTSVVGAVYYLRLVKIMYFDEAEEPIDAASSGVLTAAMAVTAALVLVFVVVVSPVVSYAEAAAKALFG